MSSLTWDRFFRLRQRRVWLQRIGGVPAVLGFLVAESSLLSLPIFDPTQTFWGIDPLVTIALGTVGGCVASYGLGSMATGWLWSRLDPVRAAQMEACQRNFYARISKYRANVPPNPTQLSFSLDYYGEKIRSVRDYRRWLRKQRELKARRVFSLRDDRQK
jgi:import inner membrane translocase subunit TIM23